MKSCLVEKCNKEAKKKGGYCPRHAAQMCKHGHIVSDNPSCNEPNDIRVVGDVAEIVLRDRMGNDVAVAIFDADKVSIVEGKKWYLHSAGYCASRGKSGSHYLHRLVSEDYRNVDHISGNKLDCRSVNLRACNQSQNIANTLARKTSKTGIKGVHPFKGGPRFAAQITHKRKVYCLGVYGTVDEAKSVYDKKAKELFGEFARCS